MLWKPCEERSKMHKSEMDSSVIDDAAPSPERSGCLNEEIKSADEGKPEFDKSARDYEALFQPWLRIAGASREYFARSRVEWLSHLLGGQEVAPTRVMDFGCGTGISLLLLADILHAKQVIGLDTSEESLAVAHQRVGSRPVELATPARYLPRQDLDLVFCSGVFHHIPVAARPAVVDYIYRCLRPGGILAMWENNPWNPIHSFAMKHSEIDKNAVPLSPPGAHRLVGVERFRVIRTDYLFFLPGYFRWLHPLEKWLIKVPLGAQYQLLARRE
jgi:SAM-dependent methyltransferase